MLSVDNEKYVVTEEWAPDNGTCLLLNIGDEDIFSKLYKKLYPSLVNYAKEILKDKEAAKDIASETLIKVWQKKGEIKDYQYLYAFAFRVARNACYDQTRSCTIHNRVHNEIKYISNEAQTDQDDNYDMRYAEYVEEMSRQIQRLPGQCLKIFKLLLEERSTTEIATQLNLSAQTVRNQKTKAINILSSVMTKKCNDSLY